MNRIRSNKGASLSSVDLLRQLTLAESLPLLCQHAWVRNKSAWPAICLFSWINFGVLCNGILILRVTFYRYALRMRNPGVFRRRGNVISLAPNMQIPAGCPCDSWNALGPSQSIFPYAWHFPRARNLTCGFCLAQHPHSKWQRFGVSLGRIRCAVYWNSVQSWLYTKTVAGAGSFVNLLTSLRCFSCYQPRFLNISGCKRYVQFRGNLENSSYIKLFEYVKNDIAPVVSVVVQRSKFAFYK